MVKAKKDWVRYQGRANAALLLTVRHFHAQAQAQLDADSVRPPNIDPALLQATIESACNDVATKH